MAATQAQGLLDPPEEELVCKPPTPGEGEAVRGGREGQDGGGGGGGGEERYKVNV